MDTKVLIGKVCDEDATERSHAIEDLGYAGAVEAIGPLIERLATEPSRKVRETIFQALERIAAPEILNQMVSMLDSEDAFLRNQAIGLLQRRGARAAPVLLDRMRDASADVRKFVVDAASGIPAAAVAPIYEAALQDEDDNVRIAAIESVGAQRLIRFKSRVEAIFLAATEPMVVCAAFGALLQIGDQESWRCIRRRYPSAIAVPTWELGWWIRALGDFGGPDEMSTFQELLGRHDGKVAPAIIDALEQFQLRHGRIAITTEFLQILRELLREPLPPEVRLQLLRVIGGFGAPADIGDLLNTLLDHPDRLTKLGAIEGLKRHGRPDLLARWRAQNSDDHDPEIAEALGENGVSP